MPFPPLVIASCLDRSTGHRSFLDMVRQESPESNREVGSAAEINRIGGDRQPSPQKSNRRTSA
eukprot:8034479-Pyramimonas_sp.AAC.1